MKNLGTERYAIFRRMRDGSRVWVCPAINLKQANQKLREPVNRDSLEYFIHDFELGVAVDSIRAEKEN